MIKSLKPLILSFASLLQFDEAPPAPVPGEGDVFVLPEDITREAGIDDAALAALAEQATEAFDAIRDSDNPDLAALTLLADAIDAIRAETDTRTAADADAAAQVEALAARVHGEPEPTPEPEPEATPEATAEAAAEGTEAPAPTAEAPAVEGAPAPAAAAATEVTAGGNAQVPRQRITVPLRNIRERAPEPEVPSGRLPLSITAAADLPGIPVGNAMTSTTDIAVAMHAKARNLGEGGSAPIATIERPVEHMIGERASFDEMSEILAAARAMPGDGSIESLVAAGGWCAPNQTLFDLFSIEGRDGLLDVPTVGIERGGIDFVLNGGPSIADVFGDPNIWLWTEADDIAALDNDGTPETDVVKVCARIPCPTFTSARLQAHGICLTHGNLSDRAYPENTRRFVDLTVAAHLHTMNARHLAAIAAASTDVTIAALQPGVTSPLLNAVELQILDYRDKFRMPMGSALEVVLPHWTKGIIRADLGYRMGVDLLGVTDQTIAAWFAQRGARIQFVYDWQALQTGGGGDGFAEAYPTSIRALIYAAGTWVKGLGGRIDLGVSRDASQNATNDHTAAWSEEFDLIAKMGHESRELILTGVLADGQVGPQTTAQAA